MDQQPLWNHWRVRPWTAGPAREIARTRVLSVDTQPFRSVSQPGKGGEFTVVRCPDWINVIALTPRREVVLVEQFRFGTSEVTLELPGGMVDLGEGPAETCRRELLEETGYGRRDGGPARIIGVVSANPALQTNRVHTGLIEDVELVSEQGGDETEEIAVHLWPLDRVPELLRSGVIHHSLVVAAFQWLSLMK